MNKKIKILFVMDHFHAVSGGTERQIYELIKGLDKDLFYVEACIFRYDTDFFERGVFPCPVFSPLIGSFFALSTYSKLYGLREYIRRNEFDIVQTIFNDSALSVPPITVGLKIMTISTRRDMGFWYTPMKLMMLRLNELFTDRYLVNSHSVCDNLHRREWVHMEKISVIYNGIDFTRFDVPKSGNLFNQLSIPEGSPIVGIVANMRQVKRVNDLIIAFALVERRVPNAHLLIVGHLGQLFEEYNLLVKQNNIEQKVHFLGMVTEPIPIMKHFAVGVNCSETEGLSNSVMEYMACGVPVVATDTSGNRELVVNGENGLLVPVGEANELAKAIIHVLENQHFQSKMVSKAKDYVSAQFDQDRIIDQYSKYYRSLIVTP